MDVERPKGKTALSRLIQGSYGALLGFGIGLAGAASVSQYYLEFAFVGGAVCFVVAFFFGDYAIGWIKEGVKRI